MKEIKILAPEVGDILHRYEKDFESESVRHFECEVIDVHESEYPQYSMIAYKSNDKSCRPLWDLEGNSHNAHIFLLDLGMVHKGAKKFRLVTIDDDLETARHRIFQAERMERHAGNL